MNTTNSELIISSTKEDIDNLINEEFYDRSRTPSYAVRIVEDAIENSPITESYLLQHDLISMTSRDASTVLPTRSSRPFSSPSWIKGSLNSRQIVPNKMHIYLSPTEIVDVKNCSDNLKLGKPTRATLLKERMNWGGYLPHSARTMNTSGRNCLSYKMENNNKIKWDGSIISCNSNLQSVNYAFMIGARYNKAHFFTRSPINQNTPPSTTKSNPSENITKKSDIISFQSFPSPPNSPKVQEQMKKIRLKKDLKFNSESSDAESTSNSKNDCIKSKTTINKPKTQPKIYPKMDSQFVPVSVKPSVLPVVVGHRYSTINNSFEPHHYSIPKTNWTRASLNLHLARQSRNLRNRRQEAIKETNTNLSITILNPPTGSEVSESNTTTTKNNNNNNNN